MKNKTFELNPLLDLAFLKKKTINCNCDDMDYNSPIIFQSEIDNIFYLIYTNDKNNSILSYDIDNNNQMWEIKNIDKIKNIIYYFDEINKRDLIIIISSNSLIIWNVINLDMLLDIKKIYQNTYLNSACILNYNNNNYIFTIDETGENYSAKSTLIKVFDFNGKKINEIKMSSIIPNNSYSQKYFIETYYDIKLSKCFIILSQKYSLISYDYNIGKLLHEYNKYSFNKDLLQIIIFDNKKDKKTELIVTDKKQILIWNFHTGKLLKSIGIIGEIQNIILWNGNYFFATFECCEIKLLEKKNGLFCKILKCGEDSIITGTKMIHSKYGECLISLSFDDNDIQKMNIKIWKNRKNIKYQK